MEPKNSCSTSPLQCPNVLHSDLDGCDDSFRTAKGGGERPDLAPAHGVADAMIKAYRSINIY